MSSYRFLELLSMGRVSMVRLLPRCLIYDQEIEELAMEWNSVVDSPDCQSLFVDCSHLTFVSSGMLSKLLVLRRRLQQKQGKLVLCGIHGELREVLRRTRLDQVFESQEEPATNGGSCDRATDTRGAGELVRVPGRSDGMPVGRGPQQRSLR